METPLISTWSQAAKLPPKYVYPPQRRPNDNVVATRIPMVELDEEEMYDRENLIKKIVRATTEFGVFEVIDHGVSHRLLNETRRVTKEFFALSPKEKYAYCSRDLDKKFILYTSSIEYDRESLHHWRDAARHCTTPIEECVRYWPQKPLGYREVVRKYVSEVRSVGSRILKLLSEGLGLDPDYFETEKLFQEPSMIVNHYPICPEPNLTWGSSEHYDPGLMTILLQDDVPGLQVLHEGTWISINPRPYSLLVNVGNLLEIVTNGKLKSVKHRVITNGTRARTTAAYFFEPRKDCRVEPAKAFVSPDNPPIYRPIYYAEVLSGIRTAFMGEMDCAMEAFIESLKQ